MVASSSIRAGRDCDREGTKVFEETGELEPVISGGMLSQGDAGVVKKGVLCESLGVASPGRRRPKLLDDCDRRMD